jgi:tRNA(Ile)-lysidine synthase
MLHLFHHFFRNDEVLFTPVVAHVQHDFRENGAKEDRAFVRALAEEHEMEFQYRTVHVRENVATDSVSPEAIARRKRYAALQEICQSIHADTVLTAHHRSDQIQTILMRLSRGTGLQGLCGIRTVRSVEEYGSDQDANAGSTTLGSREGSGGIQIVRPMLDVPKESIEKYMKEHERSWQEDPSNSNLKYRRNLVRERLVPRVQEVLQDDYPDLLLRIRQRATHIDQALREKWYGNEIAIQKREHRIMMSRSDVRACQRMLYPYLLRRIKRSLSRTKEVRYHDYRRLQRLIDDDETGREEMISGGVLLRMEHRYLVARDASQDGTERKPGGVVFHLPGTAEWMGYSFIARPAYEAEPNSEYRTNPWKERIDVARTEGPLLITQRRPGDVMKPLGMSGHKKVKEIMIDQKIPASLRDRWPVVRDRDGIVWLPGLRLSDRVRITDRASSVDIFELSCDGGDEPEMKRSDL